MRTYSFNDAKYPERIKDLREDNDLTQEQVAKLLGIAQTTYSQYENHKRAMPVEHIMTLCSYYGVSADYLLGLTNDKKIYYE